MSFKRACIFLVLLYALSAQSLSKMTWAALTTTGATTGFGTAANDIHTLTAIVTGGPSGCTVNLDASNDGTHWFDISGPQTCTSNVMFHVFGRSVELVRGNLTALSGGTAPTVTLTYLGISSGGKK